ncbi:MAG TPA: hypothetical protein VMT70_06000 [Vicinamibacteria bacterium]|nr:hypothetical protein [Vicinamibacteria bacterium]
MDEVVHYHALGCMTAPLQGDLPLIRDGCGYHDLRLPFTETLLPLRSYLYTGSFPSLPFYPFWRLLDAPVAARVQGAIFFFLVVLMAGRLLRARPSSVLLAALVYPVLLATFLVDEGPVGLSAVLLLAALLAARRALAGESRSRPVAWAVLAGLALFLGLWTKLVFAWWLPAFVAFALAETGAQGGWTALARHRRAVLAGTAAVVLPTTVLLASVDREGRPYAAVLGQGKVSAEPERVQAAAGRLTPYLVDGARVAPRNVLLPRSLLDPLPLALAVSILLLATRRREKRRAVAAWTAVAALTFVLASSSEYSQWPHHFAFPLLLFVFALALALEGLGGRARLGVAVVVLLFWGTLALRWPSATFPGESSPAKDELLRFVRARGLDRQSLQLHASWGTYYIAQLFGDRERLLLYMRSATDDPKRLELARAAAAARGRSVLLLSSRRWEKIQSPAVAAVLGPPQATWRFGDWWAVEYDPLRSSSPRR